MAILDDLRALTRPASSSANERDLVGDLAPFLVSALVAWWTTARPAAFGLFGTWTTRTLALVAVGGIIAGALVIARPTVTARLLVPITLGGFVAPCAAVWLVGSESATALSEPIEVFVGALAWAALGVVMMRPRAVAVPRGAEGGRGPTIGAGDDVARVAMREVEAEMIKGDPVARLVPRQPQPRLGAISLWLAAALACAIGVAVMRVGSNVPERAVLARIAGAGLAVALLSTAGDLVEVRYLKRVRPSAKRRFQRVMIILAVLVALAFFGAVFIPHDTP